MDESLRLERIDDTIECCEIHTAISLSDELLSEIGESRTWSESEYFDEAFARFCDAGDGHGIVG